MVDSICSRFISDTVLERVLRGVRSSTTRLSHENDQLIVLAEFGEQGENKPWVRREGFKGQIGLKRAI
jgi:hypothetical protein